MPVYKIRGPDGKLYRYRVDAENANPEDVLESFNQQYALRSAVSAFQPPKEKAGFFGSFKEAVTSLGLTDEAAAYAANPTEENRQAFLKAAESKYKSVGGFGKGENWEAFKELLGGSLGALVAPIAGGVAGAATGPLGAIGGFAGVSGAQYSIQNLRRQAEEQQAAAERGEEVPELELGKAATAAAAQAGLDVIPGALILKGLRKFPVAQRLLTKDESSNKAADVLIDAFNKGSVSLKGNVVKGVGLGVAFEVPQEIAQQALERWQAGLSLTDDEAKEEFKQAAIGAAILGGGFGAIGGYATYRGKEAARQELVRGAEEDAEIEAQREEELEEVKRAETEEAAAPSFTLTPPPAPEPAVSEEEIATEENAEIEAQRQTEFELMRQAEDESALQETRPRYDERTLREAAEAERMALGEEEPVTSTERFAYGPSPVPYYGREEGVETTTPPPAAIEPTVTEFKAPDAFNFYVTDTPAYEGVEPLSSSDADFELEVLERQAEKGKLTPAVFANSEIGKRLDTPTVSAINDGIRTDPIATVQALREQVQQKATPAVEEAATVPTPRETALEVIKTTPTIKAVAEATGLNQPQAAALMRQFVDEGLLERKGNKFTIVAPKPPVEPETADVSGAATTTEVDRGTGGGGADLFTLGPPAGELGTPPVGTEGLGTTSDVTERADVREEDVSAPLETAAPTRAADLRARALDFIRQTGKGNAPDLQKALDIPLAEAKILREALLGSGAVVQKTNVKAAKTAGKSYFVVEGTYTPEAGYRREMVDVEETTPKPEPIKQEKITKGEARRRELEEADAKAEAQGYVLRGKVRPTWKGTTTKGQLAEETRRAFAELEAEQAGAVEGQGALDLLGGKAPVVRSPVQQKMIDSILESGRFLLRSGKMSADEVSSINAEIKKREPNFKKLRKQLDRIASRDEEAEIETAEPYFDDTQKVLDEESDFLDTMDYDKYKPLDFSERRRRARFKRVRNPQIDTPEFKNWFGKSKILDNVGDAATWYIGSPVTEIEAFRTSKVKDWSGLESIRAIFASPSPNVANEFTIDRKTGGAGVVYPVHIRAEFPFDYENPTHVKNLFDELLKNAGTDTGLRSTILNFKKRIEEGAWQEIEMPIIQRAIRELGHDGFYVKEYGTKNLGVYDPNQIKSAVGNVGTFSREDNRIRFQRVRSQTVGMRADTVRALVSNIISGWRNPPRFTVVQSYLDLPAIEGIDPESNADAIGITVGNDVYIVADNVRTPRDLKATVFHESLGHYGLEQLFGSRLFQTLLDIYKTNRNIQADADAWLEENGAAYPETKYTQEERQAIAVEEILAEMSEGGPIQNPKWRAAFNRVAALVRKFARALGQLVGKNLAYSNAEVADIIVQAHNKVISGRTQLIPRYNNIRYMKTFYNKTLKNAINVANNAPGATKEILTGTVQSLDKVPNSLRNAKLATFSMSHIMQLFEKYAPAYRALNNMIERKAYDATREMVEFSKDSTKYHEILRNNKQYVDEFNRLSHFINLTQTPLFEEQLNANGEFVKFVLNNAEAQRMRGIPVNSAAYNALSSDDKVLHEAVARYDALPNEVQQLIADVYTDWRNYSDTAFKVKTNQLLSRLPAAVVAAIKANFQKNRLKFYLPLPREGLYKLAYLDNNGTRVSELFSSLAERDVAEEKASRQGFTVLDEPKVLQQRNYRDDSPLPTGLLSELLKNVEESLTKAGVSSNDIDLAKESVFDTFIDFMPGAYGNDLRQEISSRKTFMLNGVMYYGRLGFDEDVLAAYDRRIPNIIYQINNLKYVMPFEKVKKLIKEQLKTYRANKGAPQYAGLGDLDDNYLRSLQEDLDARITFAKKLQQYSPYVYTISKANYIYSIALNISSALINTTILPMMAWPALAAKYGVADASKAIAQSMQLFFSHSYRDPATGRINFNYKRLADMPASFGGPNMPSGYLQTAHGKEFERLHKALLARSVVGTAAEQELIQAENIQVPGYEGLSAKVNLAMSYVFRSSERMNREVSSLAAYMLARNMDVNGQAFSSSRGQASVSKAIEEAIRLNYDVNGATTPETNSRLYQSDIGRIALTFRTHALNMILNLAFTFNQAIEQINANQPNAAERKLLRTMARKKMLYIFGTTYMLAGIKGLPLFGAAEVLASLLMGDDDEPYDLEQEVLDSVGTLGLNGPLNELLNVDIGSRTGFYGLFWRDDPKRLAEVGSVVYVLERLAGPTYGLVEAARRGFSDLADGELVRASEALTPAPIRNMIKGMRYGIDGALTRDGLPIVEDVSTYNSMMQVLGFAPADLATAQAQRGATYQIGEKLKNRRVALLTNLYAARKAGNSEAMEKALEDIRNFNEANPAYRITGATIRKSYDERERRAREAIGGVFQPRSLRIATSEYVAELDEEDGLF